MIVCEDFESFVGDGSKGSYSKMIRSLFTAFINCDETISSNQISTLISRLAIETTDLELEAIKPINKRKTRENSLGGDGQECNNDDASMRALILYLHKDYPKDLGALCPFLLNCLSLSQGEAFFMGPNEPHAYISGSYMHYILDLLVKNLFLSIYGKIFTTF
jgi:mannose-6-phosphate isomerase class I